METYFYCSFEHSQTGFFHTRLENDGLVPVENGHDGLPEALGRFFSYGQFLVLWRDLSLPVSKPWQQPQVTASLFGLRELKGSFADGRSGTVNLAFYAAPEEATLLRRVALSVLGSFDEFAQMLFSWLQVGGPCGYQLDGVSAVGAGMRRAQPAADTGTKGRSRHCAAAVPAADTAAADRAGAAALGRMHQQLEGDRGHPWRPRQLAGEAPLRIDGGRV